MIQVGIIAINKFYVSTMKINASSSAKIRSSTPSGGRMGAATSAVTAASRVRGRSTGERVIEGRSDGVLAKILRKFYTFEIIIYCSHLKFKVIIF